MVAYVFVLSNLRDHRDAIQAALARYRQRAEDGGLEAVDALIRRQSSSSRGKSFFVRVVNPENQTLLLSHPRLWEEFEFASQSVAGLEGRWHYYPAKRDGDLLEVASARLANGDLLQVGKSIQDREEVLEHFRDTLLATVIPMVLIGLTGGAFLASRALRPVRNLTRVVRSIVDTGRFDARVPDTRARDELSDLVTLFNVMLAKIEKLVQSMKEALDNVAHDLRTPVMRLRVVAEEALRSDADGQARHEALADCLEETEKLTLMLDTLMDISEAETGAMKLAIETIDLAALINEVMDLYSYAAEEKGVTVQVRATPALLLRADRMRLRQVIANLVDNAIKYTPEGGRVELETLESDGQALLVVRDTGIGIPAAEIERIWERLYRGDKSRSQRGLGLGLSLVKAVVERHQGSVAVQSDPKTGSVFSVHLPLAGEAEPG
ncbi:MAG TPA: ATP-binding protein [Methylomirabilota bacterium]|nr:ATP-binding protein [Methylomirabilota bacterium]